MCLTTCISSCILRLNTYLLSSGISSSSSSLRNILYLCKEDLYSKISQSIHFYRLMPLEIAFICSKALRFNAEVSFAACFIASKDSSSDFEKYAHIYAYCCFSCLMIISMKLSVPTKLYFLHKHAKNIYIYIYMLVSYIFCVSFLRFFPS